MSTASNKPLQSYSECIDWLASRGVAAFFRRNGFTISIRFVDVESKPRLENTVWVSVIAAQAARFDMIEAEFVRGTNEFRDASQGT